MIKADKRELAEYCNIYMNAKVTKMKWSKNYEVTENCLCICFEREILYFPLERW